MIGRGRGALRLRRKSSFSASCEPVTSSIYLVMKVHLRVIGQPLTSPLLSYLFAGHRTHVRAVSYVGFYPSRFVSFRAAKKTTRQNPTLPHFPFHPLHFTSTIMSTTTVTNVEPIRLQSYPQTREIVEAMPPAQAAIAKQRWNAPDNKWRVFAACVSFFICGMNDGSYGVCSFTMN